MLDKSSTPSKQMREKGVHMLDKSSTPSKQMGEKGVLKQFFFDQYTIRKKTNANVINRRVKKTQTEFLYL
jgi:hypothetical protein